MAEQDKDEYKVVSECVQQHQYSVGEASVSSTQQDLQQEQLGVHEWYLQQFEHFIEDQEKREGVRFSWNVWPRNRVEATRLVVPFAVAYTPFKQRADLTLVHYKPFRCTKQLCCAVLNPYCQVNSITKSWTCCFCFHQNPLPKCYWSISNKQMPLELSVQCSTIEYAITNPEPLSPIFLFVVDTCVDQEELESLKSSMAMTFSLLPPDALIGLITFDCCVHVHILTDQGMKTQYVFPGDKVQTAETVQMYFEGLGVAQNTSLKAQESNKVLQPTKKCEAKLQEALHKYDWPLGSRKRPLRATGAALSVAVSLLELCGTKTCGCILTFVGGACTIGPGQVVGQDLSNTIRSHNDIKKKSCEYMESSSQYYKNLARRASDNGHTLHLFAFALDQVGLLEMKYLAKYTGGHMVLGECFSSYHFGMIMKHMFAHNDKDNIDMAFNATMQVKTSQEVKIVGALGPCVSATEGDHNTSDIQLGAGKTNKWKLCGLTPSSTISIIFEITSLPGTTSTAWQQNIMQFITTYQHLSGHSRVRVTTVTRPWANPETSLDYISYGFDSEAAAVLVARLVVHRCENDLGEEEAVVWIDRMLIRLCKKLGEHVTRDSNSHGLYRNFLVFPYYMYNLRRSPFLKFNSSPDETAFYRCMLNREVVTESLTMIKPLLYRLTLCGAKEEVMLEASSIRPDDILLLDTYFIVLVYMGEKVAARMKEDKLESYAKLRHVLETVVGLGDHPGKRFPASHYIMTEHGHSQARFLLSKVNPSPNDSSFAPSKEGGGSLPTDDISYYDFSEILKKMAS